MGTFNVYVNDYTETTKTFEVTGTVAEEVGSALVFFEGEEGQALAAVHLNHFIYYTYEPDAV